MNILARNTQGAEQPISFPEIPDQKVGTESLKLNATSDANLPVHCFIREGPRKLTAIRSTINADGADVSVFTVATPDAQGRVVPVAQNKINFNIEGAGNGEIKLTATADGLQSTAATVQTQPCACGPACRKRAKLEEIMRVDG